MSEALQKASFDYSDENHLKENSQEFSRERMDAEQTFSTDKTNSSTRGKDTRNHKYRHDKFMTIDKVNHLPSI